MAAARPVDHASRMEASRVRLATSRKLCQSTGVIIRETRVTIERALEILDNPHPDGPDDRPKRARSSLSGASLTAAGRFRQCARDEDESAVDIG